VKHVARDLEQLDDLVKIDDLHVSTITSGMDAMSATSRCGRARTCTMCSTGRAPCSATTTTSRTRQIQVEPSDHKGCNVVQW
jgi:cobalt-zinc-cadmium efflux system protein